MISRLAIILSAVLTVSVAGIATAAEKPQGGTICQGNTIYVVCVDDTGAIGRYTAATGPAHPVPNRNLLFGGEGQAPGTSFSSYRSFTSGTTYTQGEVTDGTDLSPVASTSTIGTTGVRTTYNVTSPDGLQIEQVVNVNGTTFDDSNVEVTTTITNTGSAAAALGIRYLWDYEIGEDDGPTFRQRQPDGVVLTTETEFRPPGFVYYEIQDNEFDDPTTPLYTVLASANGPATVTPPPTAPTQITFGSWPHSVGTAFDYVGTPGRDIATQEGVNDSAVLYWWGRDASSALALGPGASVTRRALIFATQPGEPPPFDITRPTCRIVSRTSTSVEVEVEDDQSGLDEVNISNVDNAEVVVESFTDGTTDPVTVTGTKVDESRRARFRLEAVDMAGNKGYCTNSGFIFW